MRVDLFKVLVDTRIRITAAASALDARRDFGLAEVDLQAALTFGNGSRGADSGPATMGTASSATMDR